MTPESTSNNWQRFPSTSVPGITISMRLFCGLKYPAKVHASALQGGLAGALVSATLVLDRLQLLTAANQALGHQAEGRMCTKSIHTELLYCLSPTKNISQSLSTFGLNDRTKSCVAVVFHPALADDLDKVELNLANQLECEDGSADFTDSGVNPLCDVAQLGSVYKVTAEEQEMGKVSGDSLSMCLVTRIACKDIVTV